MRSRGGELYRRSFYVKDMSLKIVWYTISKNYEIFIRLIQMSKKFLKFQPERGNLDGVRTSTSPHSWFRVLYSKYCGYTVTSQLFRLSTRIILRKWNWIFFRLSFQNEFKYKTPTQNIHWKLFSLMFLKKKLVSNEPGTTYSAHT